MVMYHGHAGFNHAQGPRCWVWKMPSGGSCLTEGPPPLAPPFTAGEAGTVGPALLTAAPFLGQPGGGAPLLGCLGHRTPSAGHICQGLRLSFCSTPLPPTLLPPRAQNGSFQNV